MVLSLYDQTDVLPSTLDHTPIIKNTWLSRLCAMSPLLCVYPAQHWSPLAGLELSDHCQLHLNIHSDGVDECLDWFDTDGRRCWRLCRLPCSGATGWMQAQKAAASALHKQPAAQAKPLSEHEMGSAWQALALEFVDYADASFACVYAREHRLRGVCQQVATRMTRHISF